MKNYTYKVEYREYHGACDCCTDYEETYYLYKGDQLIGEYGNYDYMIEGILYHEGISLTLE